MTPFYRKRANNLYLIFAIFGRVTHITPPPQARRSWWMVPRWRYLVTPVLSEPKIISRLSLTSKFQRSVKKKTLKDVIKKVLHSISPTQKTHPGRFLGMQSGCHSIYCIGEHRRPIWIIFSHICYKYLPTCSTIFNSLPIAPFMLQPPET